VSSKFEKDETPMKDPEAETSTEPKRLVQQRKAGSGSIGLVTRGAVAMGTQQPKGWKKGNCVWGTQEKGNGGLRQSLDVKGSARPFPYRGSR